jgi:hypothetical protein
VGKDSTSLNFVISGIYTIPSINILQKLHYQRRTLQFTAISDGIHVQSEVLTMVNIKTVAFCHEDGGNRFLQNVRRNPPDYKTAFLKVSIFSILNSQYF